MLAVRETSEIDIDTLMSSLVNIGRNAVELHNAMINMSVRGDLMYGNVDQPITLLAIVRIFLRYHTLVELSDPRCFLEPAPGDKIRYSSEIHREVISLSSRAAAGRIPDGEEVEVVFPGLFYLESEASGKKMQVAPPLIRRLAAADTSRSWW